MKPQNLINGNVAIHGYDPVSFFSDSPNKGQSNITVSWDGATYQFANKDNKATFEADPQLYLPQYGGYCAHALSLGQSVDVDPQVYVISNNRLYLFENNEAVVSWQADEATCCQSADRNWSKSEALAA